MNIYYENILYIQVTLLQLFCSCFCSYTIYQIITLLVPPPTPTISEQLFRIEYQVWILDAIHRGWLGLVLWLGLGLGHFCSLKRASFDLFLTGAYLYSLHLSWFSQLICISRLRATQHAHKICKYNMHTIQPLINQEILPFLI